MVRRFPATISNYHEIVVELQVYDCLNLGFQTVSPKRDSGAWITASCLCDARSRKHMSLHAKVAAATPNDKRTGTNP